MMLNFKDSYREEHKLIQFPANKVILKYKIVSVLFENINNNFMAFFQGFANNIGIGNNPAKLANGML